MVKRAARPSENVTPAALPREPTSPPANDNRQPGLFVAIAVLILGVVAIGAVAWWAFS